MYLTHQSLLTIIDNLNPVVTFGEKCGFDSEIKSKHGEVFANICATTYDIRVFFNFITSEYKSTVWDSNGYYLLTLGEYKSLSELTAALKVFIDSQPDTESDFEHSIEEFETPSGQLIRYSETDMQLLIDNIIRKQKVEENAKNSIVG